MMPDKLFLKTRHYLVCLLLILCFCPATGQEYSYARYDVDQGLAGSVVYDAKEDKDGFLWFATETGVSRFDGTKFRNFTRTDGLPDNEVPSLFVDSRNRLWMMPFHSSLCYYYKGKIYTKENDSLLSNIPAGVQIADMVEDKDGCLLLKATNGLYYLNAQGRLEATLEYSKTRFLPVHIGLNKNGNFNCIYDSGYIGTVFRSEYDHHGRLLHHEAYSYTPISRLSIYLSPTFSIYRDKDSMCIELHNIGSKTRIPFPTGFNSISGINDSLCAFNTNNGSLLFNVRSRQTVRHILQGKTVNNVFCDSEGNWWFLTGGAGVFRIGSFEFTNYVFNTQCKDASPAYSLYKQGSLLYVGSDKATYFTINTTNHRIQPHRIEGAAINAKISVIVPLQEKGIFLGTDNGVYQVTASQPFPRTVEAVATKGMHADGDSLLVSVHNGLIKLHSNLKNRDLSVGFRSTCSYVMNDTIYIGSIDGLYVFQSTYKKQWLGSIWPELSARITGLEGGKDGILWIGTQGYGIIGYKGRKIVSQIDTKDGLASDMIRHIFVDSNTVWAGTDRGLSRVVFANGHPTITNYTRSDGLIADQINASYVVGDTVYVATPAGVTTFNANKISLNSYCKLRVTGLHADNQSWSVDTTDFRLPPSGNSIRFEYVGISYRTAGDITYRYRMLGLSDEWQTTHETFLTYPSLPSGDFTLQLIAVNKFGIQSDLLSIPFRVDKFFWEKSWFRVLAIIIVWAFVWIFVHHRIKRVRKQNDEKIQINNRMADLEQMALKAQMNPHFIFNSLNSVQQYVIDKDILGANKFITDFSRLIRLTLDISSKTKISLYDEISYLTTYLELERTKFEDKFNYAVTVTPNLDTSGHFIPPMVLQPYVENSIRHGVRNRLDDKGYVKVSFRADDRYLICSIEDNGVGRKKAGQYKSQLAIEYQSKGMTLTARRLEMLNRNLQTLIKIDIEDLENNNEPLGTRVTLRFPLNYIGRTNTF